VEWLIVTEKRAEGVDCRLPQVHPVPTTAGADYEGKFEPDGSRGQFCGVSGGGVDLFMGCVMLPRSLCRHA
jgi:hypothetical protein